MSREALIDVRDVTKVYGTGPSVIAGLRGVSLRILAGMSVAIVGPSGGGKSTLLNLVGGLDRPSQGTVCVAGLRLDLAPEDKVRSFRRRSLGIVFQALNLLPSLTAEENVALPLLADGHSMREARAQALAALRLVDMHGRSGSRPAELSGGQQQRVAIARALVHRPAVLLADEPTGSLDSQAGTQILALLAELQRTLPFTTVLVTHDTTIAAACDRVVTIVDGRIAGDTSTSLRSGTA